MDGNKIKETENFIQELEQEESLWNVVHPKFFVHSDRFFRFFAFFLKFFVI